MSIAEWLGFVAASAALLAVPGPTVILVASYALGHGKSSAWATVPGVVLGDFTAMTVSLLGAGAVLAASSALFEALRLAGAAYLIWLGIKLWRASPGPGVRPAQARTGARRMFRNTYLVTALNPKSIVFFVAFVPQFVDPSEPAAVQFAILEATFLMLAALNVTLWALFAAGMHAHFRRSGARLLAQRLGGGFLIGAGLLTVAVRRSA